MTTCPVCGLGRWKMAAHASQQVSHLACVENIYTANLSLRVRVQQAEREAAFWKWLWELGEAPTREPSIGHWLAHMRERWERGARP
jgi:hypothetical protein